MTQINSKDLRLQELFSNKSIVKVFHDCIEDLSLLYNLCNIKDIKGIFDTQIAHRMCCDDPSYKGVKNSAISLAMLIKVYLNIEYEIKGEMHNLMAQNPYLWKTRPLTEKLNSPDILGSLPINVLRSVDFPIPFVPLIHILSPLPRCSENGGKIALLL